MERDPIKLKKTDAPVEDHRWQATFGDYDLDDPVGTGSTPEEAIENLKWQVGEDE